MKVTIFKLYELIDLKKCSNETFFKCSPTMKLQIVFKNYKQVLKLYNTRSKFEPKNNSIKDDFI